LIWLQIAGQQYRDLPEDLRTLTDRRLAQLIENPTADPDADYNQASDQWSVPLGEHGLLFYAVVRDPATVDRASLGQLLTSPLSRNHGCMQGAG
jgi:hypothetical protein